MATYEIRYADDDHHDQPAAYRPYYTITAIVQNCGMSRAALYGLIVGKHIRTIRHGKRHWILKEEWQRYQAGLLRVEHYHTIKDICHDYGLKNMTVKKWIERGKLPSVKFLGVHHILRDHWSSFLEANQDKLRALRSLPK